MQKIEVEEKAGPEEQTLGTDELVEAGNIMKTALSTHGVKGKTMLSSEMDI